MKRVRINGWYRIGIVLTVLWLVAAFIMAKNVQMAQAENYREMLIAACTLEADKSKSSADCFGTAYQEAERVYSWYWVKTFILKGVGSTILAWILIFISVGTFKWIKAGFKKQKMDE